MTPVGHMSYNPAEVKNVDWRKINRGYNLTQFSNVDKCSYCGKRAGLKCAGCLRVAYCSQEHQKVM